MKLTGFRPLFTLFVILAAAALNACGGDDALSDEEYFRKLDEIDKETDRRFDEDVFGDQSLNAKTGAQAFLNVASYVRDEAEKLKPPDDAKDAHEELVAAIDEYVNGGEGAIDELSEDDPVEAFFDNEAFDSTRVDNAFCAVQDLADQKNIDADVGCDGGEEAVDPSTLPAVEATEVEIQDFAFDPPHIQVTVGDTVTWTQGADPEAHTVTADDGTFDSGPLEEGETFEFTFEEAGDFPYFCEPHPEMLGLVTVVE